MAYTVVIGDISDEVVARLQQEHEVAIVNAAELATPAAARSFARADGIIVTGQVPIDQRFLDAAPRLRVLSLRAVGYDRVDLDACKRRGVIVCNTPGVLDGAVADLTLLLLLGVARCIAANIAAARGEWYASGNRPPLGVDVRGKVLGILGLGRIGKAVARSAANGFGMTVTYHNRHRDPQADGLATYVYRDELFRRSDFVSVHMPLNPETRGSVGVREIGCMPAHAIFINTARAAIVDEAALVAALRGRRIAGAGLDVSAVTPLPPDHPLCCLPNVLLTPYIGSATVETRLAMADLAARNLLAGLRGEEPESRVA